MRHPVIEEDLADIVARDVPWGAFEGKTVLVSGAYGFISAYLVETLLYLNEVHAGFGTTVLALGRSPEKAGRRFAHYLDREDLVFLYQDVCDPVRVDRKIDFIIHGASWASPKYYGKCPADVLKPNVYGTGRLLETAREHQSRGFLFLSSAENYGALEPEKIPISEDTYGNVDPMKVRSCYAESKRMGEAMCAAWHCQYGVPTRCARIFHTYGPGMALDDGRVFADFVADIVENRDLHMKSDGTARRAYCYLVDAADGLFRILLQGDAGAAYNMGNDDAECSVGELADTLVGLFPERNLKVVRAEETRQGYLQTAVNRTVPDTTRLRSLGWRPSFGVADGFGRTIRSYL